MKCARPRTGGREVARRACGCYGDHRVKRERRAKRRMPRRLTRAIAFAFASLVLSFAFVCGVLRATGAPAAGAHYFYCEAMGLLESDPCDAGAHRSDRGDPAREVHEQHFDCCQVGTLPPMPDGTIARAPSVPAPALLAIIAPSPIVDPHSTNDLRRPARAYEKWRAPPRRPSERRAALMVFLT